MSPSRTYRSMAAGIVLRVTAVISIVATVALTIATFVQAKTPVAGVVMTAFVAPYVVLTVRIMQAGLRIEEDGVTVLNPWRRPHLRWSEIERFEILRPTGRTRVIPISGRPIIIRGVAQSNWTTYYRPRRDTPERRWVEEWNALLAQHRATTVA